MQSYEIVARDRKGYGHEPKRYNGIPAESRAEAIAEARSRYGKETGLDAADIRVEVLA